MGYRSFVASLGLLSLFAQAADAALDRYRVRNFSLADFATKTPKTTIETHSEPGDGATNDSTVVVDRSGPTLRKLLVIQQGASTFNVSFFNGFIWFSTNWRDGPKGSFTATSSTLSTATNVGTVVWPILTGWTITGATFCHADPAFICSLAVGENLGSVDPDLRSTFYDIGPWTFHGTGFTSNPFVFFTSTTQGNSQILLKGALDPNATVPALPLLGVGALGASLFAMGVAALRRRRG
jgi:hypothetical protein